ncbi:hypothetical protein COO09_06800 [Rhizorhabdus dicambivorans]|uniref:Uncharacterized protein n=1 Tax=Rhizorhabdus dicambivorans TaxID=1850238 RepID=A0A2A4FZ60_9SPHN|nr:hypothetical protein CMV14_17015 [Rhizorhabdus dicambivorans]PCE43008.1 hypothetical protein COO09_06800 [Rhizorhabdus dicambivorans]
MMFLPIGSGAGPGSAAGICGKQDEQSYQRKADLPRGVVEAIGNVMADRGQPYQRGDVMQKGVPLYRFVRATRSGCRIRISYEGGGFVQQQGTMSLYWAGKRWVVDR